MTPTNGGAAGAEPREEHLVLEEVRALQQDAREVLHALERLSTSVNTAMRERVERHPFTMIGAGFLAGWILGGGLSVRMLGLLAAAAARTAAANMLRTGSERR